MWYEIKIKTQSEAVEAIYPILYSYHVSGIVTEDPNDIIYSTTYKGDWDYFDEKTIQFEYEGTLIKGYIEIEDIKPLVNELQLKIKGLTAFGLNALPAEVDYVEVHEEDWVNEWKQYYKPFEIAEGIIIKPLWEDYHKKSNELVITMDPGKAFGTGTHETTSLCAKMIKKYASHAKTMYDIGCGSGILAIIAKALGVENVTGIDFDKKAIESSLENASLNDFNERITFVQGNLVDTLHDTADIIVANIIADVIITLSEQVGAFMHKESLFIASGILLERTSDVKEALIKNHFKIIEVKTEGEWSVIVSKKECVHHE